MQGGDIPSKAESGPPGQMFMVSEHHESPAFEQTKIRKLKITLESALILLRGARGEIGVNKSL
jgi:hypothetical protein